MPENKKEEKSFSQRKDDDKNQKRELCGYTSNKVMDKFSEFGDNLSLFIGGGTTTSYFFKIFIKHRFSQIGYPS